MPRSYDNSYLRRYNISDYTREYAGDKCYHLYHHRKPTPVMTCVRRVDR